MEQNILKEKIYSVTELNTAIKIYIEANEKFANFFLNGEVSNITYHKSGHLYFTMKDKYSTVKCVCFSYKMKRIKEDLKEGDLVNIFGHVTLYEATGQYQILVDFIEKQNKTGVLYEQFEKLKQKLSSLGYFDSDHKKKMPFLPANIGIVTAETGAAVRDIINTIKKRNPNTNIYLYPAKVQGDGAEKEIIKGIEILNSLDLIDIIIIGRGGGSIEDLWCFNSEELAKAVYNSKKPIVSAVGHEIDFVITDFVADVRAATPTQAAEIIIPEIKNIKQLLENRKNKVEYALKKSLEISKKELLNRENQYIIRNFMSTIDSRRQMVIDKEEKIEELIKLKIEKYKDELDRRGHKLEALNPKNVLKRGFSITTINGKVLKNLEEIEINDIIETTLYKGKMESKVTKLD